MNSPSKASSHFTKLHYDDEKKKNFMTCKHCLKKLVDSGNSTCMVSHLRSCRPDIPLINKVKGLPTNIFQVAIPSSTDSSVESTTFDTPSKNLRSNNQNTPLKAMLLSNTPYQVNSVERNKLVNQLLQFIVDMDMPISTEKLLRSGTSARKSRLCLLMELSI